MKSFSEAIQIFSAPGEPARGIEEARERAQQHGQMITDKYGCLDDEIRSDDLTFRIMWFLVVAATEQMEKGESTPSETLMQMVYSSFRHGLIVGIEMERRDLEEEENEMAGFYKSTKQEYQPEQKRPDFPCTPKQVKKLLVMLSLNELIDSWFEDRERVFDVDGAIEWVRQTIGVPVKDLDGLTQKQIGKCFEELGES